MFFVYNFDVEFDAIVYSTFMYDFHSCFFSLQFNYKN